MINSLNNTLLLVLGYGTIANIHETGLVPPHTLDILTHIGFYMDEINTVVQGGSKQQRQVFDGTALKKSISCY